jgi:hypothetical protein
MGEGLGTFDLMHFYWLPTPAVTRPELLDN